MSLIPSCKDVTEHASDYVDRHLPLHKRAGFLLHLFICVHCRRYVEQLKLTIETIKKSADATPPLVNPQQVQEIVKHLQQQSGKQAQEP